MTNLTTTRTTEMTCGTGYGDGTTVKVTRTEVSFSIRDEKGRDCGSIIRIEDRGEDFATQTWTCPAWHSKAGQTINKYDHRFSVGVQAARDGEKYGASNCHTKGFRTAEAAMAYAMKQCGEQAKRYAKKYAAAAQAA